MAALGARFVDANDPLKARDSIFAASKTMGTRADGKKTLGGNLVPKAGYGWRNLFVEWDWDNWIKPQVDRAVKLGMNSVRLIGSTQAVTGTVGWSPWATSTAVSLDTAVRNGGLLYRCIVAGTTASSGGGPTGTSASITDGSVTWEYVRSGVGSWSPITQSAYDAHWVQLAEYCASVGLTLYPCLCEVVNFDDISPGNFQNATITASIVTTAQRLSAYPNVIRFDIFQEGDRRTGTPWAQSRVYGLNSKINNGGKAYICTTAGTSASSGSGPSGTGTGITDGTAVWSYVAVPLLPADVLALATAIRAVSNVPITMSLSGGDIDYFWNDQYSLWYLSWPSLDFIDIHIYSSSVVAADLDFFALSLNKPILIGEFGADQSLSSDAQTARYNAVVPIHNRRDVLGSYVWGLADQGSAKPANLAGVWDNTGYSLTTPLSTTSGKRSIPASVLPKRVVATPPEQWQPPNLALPSVSRPPRSSIWPGGYEPPRWSGTDSNGELVSDPRGLGLKCLVAGTSGMTLQTHPNNLIPVVGSAWYKLIFEVVADTVPRSVDVQVLWKDGSDTNLSTSPACRSADAVNMPTRIEILAQAHPSAVSAAPRIYWNNMAINEVHILRSFRMEVA